MSQQHDNSSEHVGPDADPLLDAFLSEMLGGATPPDLTERIMRRHEAMRRAAAKQARADSMLPPAFGSITAAAREESGIEVLNGGRSVEPVGVALPSGNGTSRTARSDRRRRRKHRRTSFMYAAAIALSAVVVGGAVAVIAYNQSNQPGGQPIAGGQNQPPRKPPTPNHDRPPSDQIVENSQGTPDRIDTPRDDQQNRSGPPNNERHFNGSPPFEIVDNQNQADPKTPQRPYVDPLFDNQVVAMVNTGIEQAWADAGVDPSAMAADSEFARRVYLRVLGRIPTVAELTHYLGDERPEKQKELLDLLLNGKKYRDEYAQNWAEFWTNVLIGRRGGMREDSLADRDGMTDYLRESLAENKPFDQITYEILTAEGTNKPDSPDYNGAVNFLLASYDKEGTLATNRTTRIFLGKQLQCSQCHNHHVNEWPQEQYWQVNSFFRQMKAEKQRGTSIVRLVDRDFAGASGSYDEAEVFYEQVNGLGKVAYPVWLDGEAIDPDGRVSKVRRRVELARRVIASDDFARATVNRLWDHFLGRGFTRPLDDMGPHNPPSHPDLLAGLADQFAAHDHDLKKLIRWIVLSEPFNRSSRPTETNLADTAETPDRPLFSRYYTRQMEAEELYDSLVMLADSRTGSSGAPQAADVLAKRAFVGQFARDMNTDEGNEIISFDGSMQQSLSMMNGDLMDRATDVDSGNILRRVLRSNDMSWNDKIEHLFMASLSREPTRRELQVADRLRQSHQGNGAAALQDLWWALLNSNEFILDH